MKKLIFGLVIGGALMASPVIAKEVPVSPNGDIELAHRLENAFVKVAEKASESVVVISTATKVRLPAMTDEDEELPEEFRQSPFEFFFRRYHGQQRPHPRNAEGQGSGVIIRADGYILTNGHVIDGVDKITVRLKDGRELEGKLIATDPRTDVAVIKVDAKDLPTAQLGNSDQMKVGQWAIAIGAPFELDYSFTVGFISAKGRSAVMSRGGNAYEDYIQTDASINPGNSGGPLCDIEGRVIGINTLIRGMNTGIGFAIPINMARDIATQLIDKGHIVRPWIGIRIETLAENPDLTDIVKEGVVVRRIEPDAPAAKSDLKVADIIVAVDGVKVKSPRELQQQILKKNIGDRVALDVIRDGKPAKVTIQTAEMTETRVVASRKEKPVEKGESAFGLTVQPLTKELAKQFGVEVGEGVVVTYVAEDSPAAEKGLKHGDVITEVNRMPVHTPEEFKAAVAKADLKKGVLIFMKRDGVANFEVLKED